MYAVIEAGGKQHRVAVGDVLKVEKMDIPVGDAVTFDKVLMVAKDEDVTIGTPFVKDVQVTGKVLSHGKEKKVAVFHYKRKKNIRKFKGHRQQYTEVSIEALNI